MQFTIPLNWKLKVENLGKKYTIRHEQRERYTALRDVIAGKATSLFQKLKFGKQKTEIKNDEGSDQFQLSKFPLSALPSFCISAFQRFSVSGLALVSVELTSARFLESLKS